MRSEKAEARLRKIRSRETPYLLHLCGVDIEVHKNVYPTSELSELVVACFDHPTFGIHNGSQVLDYGTGTGFLAIQAALRGASVVAIDINLDAVRCARRNSERMGVLDRIDIRESRNFGAIRSNERFDCIVAGMPWEEAETDDLLERALYDPSFEMRRALLRQARSHLSVGGRILVTYSEEMQAKQPIEQFDATFRYEIVNRRSIKGEEHYVYRITPAEWRDGR